jgi:Pilin (bacterial filament)
MAEAIAAIAACKTSIVEFASTRQAWPTDVTNAGCSNIPTKYVASMAVSAAGVMTAATTCTGAGNCNLLLSPLGGSFSSITGWSGTTTCSAKYVPSNFR